MKKGGTTNGTTRGETDEDSKRTNSTDAKDLDRSGESCRTEHTAAKSNHVAGGLNDDTKTNAK